MAQVPPERCLNCGEPLKGSFCHHCGQKATDINQPLSQLVRDLFSTVFAFDTRFFRTLRPLLFRPGLLTVEYNAGRRVRYVPPLTLFAFISFFMFVTLAMSGYSAVNVSENSGDESGPEAPPPRGVWLDVEKGPDGQADEKSADAVDEGNETPSDEESDAVEATEDADEDEDDGIAGVFFARFFSAYEESPERFDAAFRNDLARSVFFLVPVFALMLKVLYLRSGTLYVQHLIMSFHLHSFAFLSIIVVSVFEVIQGWLGEAVKLPILIWFWVYLFKALRRVYGDSRWRTGLKLFVLAFCYVAVLLAVLLATLVVTVLFI